MGDFERALARTEADATETQRAAEAVVKAAKQLVAASKVGDLAALEKALAETKSRTHALNVQQRNTYEGWDFDAVGYMKDGAYFAELKETAADGPQAVRARRKGVQLPRAASGGVRRDFG